MGKSKFGGEKYTPKNLGAEPALEHVESGAKPPTKVKKAVSAEVAGDELTSRLEALLSQKVAETLRIPIGAKDRVKSLQEKRLRNGQKVSKDSLYLEGLNLLFESEGI